MKMAGKNVDVFKRVKVIQFFLFWLMMFLVAFYYLKKPHSYGFVLFLIFGVMFSYILTAFYFIQMSGYVGKDVGESISGFYSKHAKGINLIIKIILGVAFVYGLIYLWFKIPSDIREGFNQLAGVVGVILAILTFAYFNKKLK